MKRVSVLVVLALSGCFGFDERLAACRRGELGCTSQDTCSLADDLLNNGSFERPGASSAFAAWNGTPELIRHEGNADSCRFWAEQTSTTADAIYLENPFDLGAPAPAGTMFELGVSLKSLDGNHQPMVIQLRVRNSGYTVARTDRLNNDGSWTKVFVQLALPEASSELSFEMNSEEPRSVGIDRGYVRRL